MEWNIYNHRHRELSLSLNRHHINKTLKVGVFISGRKTVPCSTGAQLDSRPDKLKIKSGREQWNWLIKSVPMSQVFRFSIRVFKKRTENRAGNR